MRMAAIVGYLHPREAVGFWAVSRTTARHPTKWIFELFRPLLR